LNKNKENRIIIFCSKDLKIQVVALVNDTVGTLMACSSTYRDCKAGVILGTGISKNSFLFKFNVDFVC